MMLSLDRLNQVLTYNPETGVFNWKQAISNRVHVGAEAGAITRNGYRMIRVDGENLYAHRLAWMFVHGQMPDRIIDHVNLDRDDNRIENLRECDHSENNCNSYLRRDSPSGIKGVGWDSHREKWACSVRHRGRRLRKRFDTLAEAENWVRSVRESLHGEFVNHGKTQTNDEENRDA